MRDIQGLIKRDEHQFWSQTWFEFLSLPIASRVTLETSLSLSQGLSFLTCKGG